MVLRYVLNDENVKVSACVVDSFLTLLQKPLDKGTVIAMSAHFDRAR